MQIGILLYLFYHITQFGVVQSNSPKFFLSLSIDCIKMRAKACSIYNENVHSNTGIIFNTPETEEYSKFANAKITRVLFLIPVLFLGVLKLKFTFAQWHGYYF